MLACPARRTARHGLNSNSNRDNNGVLGLGFRVYRARVVGIVMVIIIIVSLIVCRVWELRISISQVLGGWSVGALNLS